MSFKEEWLDDILMISYLFSFSYYLISLSFAILFFYFPESSLLRFFDLSAIACYLFYESSSINLASLFACVLLLPIEYLILLLNILWPLSERLPIVLDENVF